MSYGISIANADGSIILDDTYPQIPLLYSGTATGTGDLASDLQTTVTFPAAVSRPLVFIRPRNINTMVTFWATSNTTFLFKAPSGALVDWRIYDGTGTQWGTPSGNGLAVYSSSGTILYNTDKFPPFIRQIDTALVAAEGLTNILNDLNYIKSITTNMTAYDGGLPFILGATLAPAAIYTAPGMRIVQSVGITWPSTTQIDIYWKQTQRAGSNPINGSVFQLGQRPRKSILIR